MRGALAAALAAVAFGLAPAATALAQPADAFHGQVDLRPRLNLDASAWREVAHDRVVVTLYAERESAEPAIGQAQVSTVLAPALERLKRTPEVEVQTAGYRTDPVWQQSRIVGWRTRGALQLTGKPSESFNALVGELASSLNVQSVQYLLSREARLAVEQELIGQAVQAFHAKADAAVRALGFRSYEVREVSIGGSGPIVPEFAPKTMMMARAAGADEAAPLPGAEGRTTVTTTVSGSVVLLR
ncbi:MAG TPA: SIMPL domain-containing protein [Zeimonas sp.]|nr:SIMPL domain-containing protein [Zeimonas sp.]